MQDWYVGQMGINMNNIPKRHLRGIKLVLNPPSATIRFMKLFISVQSASKKQVLKMLLGRAIIINRINAHDVEKRKVKR